MYFAWGAGSSATLEHVSLWKCAASSADFILSICKIMCALKKLQYLFELAVHLYILVVAGNMFREQVTS